MLQLIAIALLVFVLCSVASLKFPTSLLVPLLLAAVPIPLIFSIFGIVPNLESVSASLQVIELSDTVPTAAELADGYLQSLQIVFSGFVASLPAYAFAVVVLTIRALTYPAALQDVKSKAVPIVRQPIEGPV